MRRTRRDKRGGRGVVALLIAATATGVIACAIAATTVKWGRSPLERLAAAVGPHRVTRARLTGGFAYAFCDSSAPNDSLVAGLRCDRTYPGHWAEAARLTTMAAELRKPATNAQSSALSSRATASWQIILGTPQAAVDQLSAAAQAAPTD